VQKARASSLTYVEVEEIEDEDSAHNIAGRYSTISLAGLFEIPRTKKVNLTVTLRTFVFNWSFLRGGNRNLKTNSIYLFYEIVVNNPDGTPGDVVFMVLTRSAQSKDR
jgi:hypothetical protein